MNKLKLAQLANNDYLTPFIQVQRRSIYTIQLRIDHTKKFA